MRRTAISLDNYKLPNWSGKPILVVGSAPELDNHDPTWLSRFHTIGVNDSLFFFTPDFLIINDLYYDGKLPNREFEIKERYPGVLLCPEFMEQRYGIRNAGQTVTFRKSHPVDIFTHPLSAALGELYGTFSVGHLAVHLASLMNPSAIIAVGMVYNSLIHKYTKTAPLLINYIDPSNGEEAWKNDIDVHTRQGEVLNERGIATGTLDPTSWLYDPPWRKMTYSEVEALL